MTDRNNRQKRPLTDARRSGDEPPEDQSMPQYEAQPYKHETASERLAKARTQWQFGDWSKLAQLAEEPLEQHADRAHLAILAAAGLSQTGDPQLARTYLGKAREWGCDEASIRRVLVAGVYNSLGRARLAEGREARAEPLLKQATTISFPHDDAELINSARLAYQAAELGVRRPRQRPQSGERVPEVSPQRGKTGQSARVTNTSEADLEGRLIRILERLTFNVIRSGRELTLDGVRVFDAQDPFLPGKLALAFSYRVIERASNSRDARRACREFQFAVDLTWDRESRTWGSYYYLQALSRLKTYGLLEQAVPVEQQEELRQRLDWRHFVHSETYDLIDKPTNFYNVAFGIAWLRAQLGWDEAYHADILLDRVVERYRDKSSAYGFADETEGEGRYDRYSILLIAEIAHQFREAGRRLPAELQEWLRRSAEVVLVSLNRHGDGFQFGRSIGAYGDTASLEVLSAAAWHGLLTPVDTQMAYAFSQRATCKFLNFWYDDQRQAVNLWEDGRRTDSYRGKNRILGETLSLVHQHLYTHQIWTRLGLEAGPSMDADFEAWLGQRPQFTLTRFAEGDYARAMLTARDGERVFMLPLVNGANHHDRIAYYPVPFARGVIQAVPDESFPQLVPRLELEDGTVLMPLAFMRSIALSESNEGATLMVEQDALDALGQKRPVPDSRVAVRTRFDFGPGCITRTDELTPAQGIRVQSIELQCAIDATGAQWHGANVRFESGGVTGLDVDGYEPCAIEDVSSNRAFETPEGNLSTLVRWCSDPGADDGPITLSWTLKYTT